MACMERFFPWIENDHTDDVPRMMNTLTVMNDFQNLVKQASFQDVLENESSQKSGSNFKLISSPSDSESVFHLFERLTCT